MTKITGTATRLLMFALAVFAVLTTACEKKEIQGPKGEPGTPGGGGNSGISNSEVITVPSSQWKPNADSSAWEYTIASVLVTADVADKGSVKVYVKQNAGWTELPNTVGDLFTQFSFKAGAVILNFADIHGGLPARPETSDYRLVTIYQAGRAASQIPSNTEAPPASVQNN